MNTNEIGRVVGTSHRKLANSSDGSRMTTEGQG